MNNAELSVEYGYMKKSTEENTSAIKGLSDVTGALSVDLGKSLVILERIDKNQDKHEDTYNKRYSELRDKNLELIIAVEDTKNQLKWVYKGVGGTGIVALLCEVLGVSL